MQEVDSNNKFNILLAYTRVAWDDIKARLMAVPMLVYPDFNHEFRIYVNSSYK